MVQQGARLQSPHNAAALYPGVPVAAATPTPAAVVPQTATATEPPAHAGRKRKADAHDNNERLSKRLSLLNLGTFLSSFCSL